MKKDKIFSLVVKVIHEEIGFPEKEIFPETNLKRDLKANGEDLVFLAIGLEDEFETDFSDEAMRKCSTVSDIVEYVKKEKKKKERRNERRRKGCAAHH